MPNPAVVAPFPATLVITPVSRRPLRLPEETVRAVLERSAPVPSSSSPALPIPREVGRVSIVIVTFNNLVFTRLCLESLLVNTDHANDELIIVDNGSTDGTTGYLQTLARHHSHLRTIFNHGNRGFAAANNQGLDVASGDVLVLLNNDIIVPPGWLTGLVRHLEEDPSIGLIGPVTNRIGNEAEIETSYRTYGEMLRFAEDHTREHAGRFFDIRTLCMYCLAMRRDAYERIGPLDERFEVGMLEDDDYSHRAALAGYRVVCAEDVFVHHFGGASFGELFRDGEYGRILKANQQRFAEKWGIAWEPYERRQSKEYLAVVGRIGAVVRERVPPGARVLVASRGDDELLRLDGREGWHFPRTEDGTYSGQYPADSTEAIEHLEELRDRGAQYLVLPSPAFWWLDHYQGFREHLETRHQRVWGDESCVVYALAAAAGGPRSSRQSLSLKERRS